MHTLGLIPNGKEALRWLLTNSSSPPSQRSGLNSSACESLNMNASTPKVGKPLSYLRGHSSSRSWRPPEELYVAGSPVRVGRVVTPYVWFPRDIEGVKHLPV